MSPIFRSAAAFFAMLSPVRGVEYVAINATNILADASRKPIGINMDYLVDSDRRRPNAARSTEAAIREMGVPYLRYPGGEKSDSYLWSVPPWTGPKPTLARTGPGEWPASDRSLTASNDGAWIPGKEPLDFDEFMTLCRNAGGVPVIVVCYDAMYKALTTNGTRPTRAQLITSATEWVRYANVTKGYGVKYWSIGNETDYNSNGNPGATQYATDLIDFSNAMKAIDPTIKIGAQGKTSGWFQTVLTRAAAKIDFLDVHDYAGSDWTLGYDSYRNYTKDLVTSADMAIAAINSHAPAAHKERLKVIVSEMGAHSFTGDWDSGNDIGHAIVLCDQIGRHVKLPKVDFVQYWNTRWVDNDLYQLPVGTTNLLPNGGFENDLDDWPVSSDATAGNTTISTTPADVHSGTRALRVAGTTTGGRRRDITALVPPDSVFTLTAWAKISNDEVWSNGGIAFYKNGTRIRNLQWNFEGSSYREYTRRFRSGTDYDRVDLWVSKGGGTSVLCVDDFRLVTGGRPGPLTALSSDNELFASARVLAMWGEYLQKDVLSTANTTDVQVHGSRDPTTNRMTVFLINKQTASRDAVLDVKNYTAPAHAKRRVMKGTFPGDYTPTWEAAADCPVAAGKVSLALPPLSITVLDLVTSPVITSAPATGNSTPLTTASTPLSVTATDDGGDATLTYHWSVTGTPPGEVSFSDNGTYAAKNATATFSAPGVYQLLLTVRDTAGFSTTRSLPVEVLPSYALWSQARLSAHGASAAPPQDADGDGVPNLVEYACGTDPTVKDPPGTVHGATPVREGGNLTLTYRRDLSRPRLRMTVQQSANLKTWTNDGVMDEEALITGAIQTRRAVVSAAPAPKFLRIHVLEENSP